ncbi:MAG: prepilin-type N-terminal cleavage/methylation domain-containing protein [Kiritimatiellae bacterium]|nr:prepilin-type N-terminal cleavage/methylation domain-containing protein [Kiritimatiellia bacterium]
MKKAFTLIELLVVVAVLVILMGLVFKLSTLGKDSWRRTLTVERLQKVENCLSGYHAAFGSYPPVKLHGTRDIYIRTNVHGIQSTDAGDENKSIWGWNSVGERAEREAWAQVKAACLAQPVACRFPYPERYDKLVDMVSEEMKRRADSGEDTYKAYFDDESRKKRLSAGFDDGVSRNIGRHAKNKDKKDWRNIQLFKFGLMSYLLPRYLVMMNGDEVLFRDYAQWTGNNVMPSDPFSGKSYDLRGGWAQVRRDATSQQRSDSARVANIPSQSVCARWMPNLAGVCQANHEFTLFGVNIRGTSWYDRSELDVENYDIEVFTPNTGSDESTANQYILDGVTIRDGWGSDLYYYSPAPFQRYQLWSAGPNARTFPPWVSRKKLDAKANKCIGLWIFDDIVNMSH